MLTPTAAMMPARAGWLERLPLAEARPAAALAGTLVLVLVAFSVRYGFDALLSPGFPFITFFPAVILASALFGLRMGVLAGLICGGLSWYFFITPRFSFGLDRGAAAALVFYVIVVGTDVLIIHWMQRANRNLARERELGRSLAQARELLFRELQHRVSNNLQVAAGLLTLQKRKITDPDARLALDEATRRLAVIGRISRQLYRADGGARGMREFLEELCVDILDASGRTGIVLRVSADTDPPMTADAAIPLALIVAEAVANAIEHGFAGREAGRIEVEIGRDAAGLIQVDVRDDGHGLPDGFMLETSDSLGLRIARTLAGQLSGTFAMFGGSGTTARLVLPA